MFYARPTTILRSSTFFAAVAITSFASAQTVAITAEGLGPCLQQLLHMVPAYAPAAEPLAALLKVHRDLARTAAPLLPPRLCLLQRLRLPRASARCPGAGLRFRPAPCTVCLTP